MIGWMGGWMGEWVGGEMDGWIASGWVHEWMTLYLDIIKQNFLNMTVSSWAAGEG